MSADPLFVDPYNGDFHLTHDSPCRDRGLDHGITEPCDFEGDPRIAGHTIDIGSDEIHPHLYHRGLVTPGFNLDLKVVGEPGAPIRLALGSGILDLPLQTMYGDLYLQWPPLAVRSIGVVPSSGVLTLSMIVPSSWQCGETYPFQALVGAFGDPEAMLTNLLALTVK
jgi:hypothetical protein